MTRENLYVAMTRGREANHVYVATDAVDPDCDSLPDVHAHRDAHDILSGILATPGAQTSATAMIAACQDDAGSLRRLVPIRTTLLADAARARWAGALVDAGLEPGLAAAVVGGPGSGGLILALDRMAALTPDPVGEVTSLLSELDVTPIDLANRLRAGVTRWVSARVADPADVQPALSREGLDADGRALLDQVHDAVAARVSALTDAALTDSPDWLTALGPEPTTPAGRAAWVDAVAATAARLDHIPATRAALATTPSELPVPAGPTL